MKIILTQDAPAGTYDLSEVDGTLTLTLDTPQPVSPPPAQPDPPSVPAPNAGTAPPTNGIPCADGTTLPYPLTASGPGVADVAITDASGGVWTAGANVTGDCTSPRQSVVPTNAQGVAHVSLVVDFYGDGAVLKNDTFTAANVTLTFNVSFNGQTIYQSVQKTLYGRTGFWPIRWSALPWQAVDLSKLPNYDLTCVPSIADWTSGHLGIDQRAFAPYAGEGSPGERMELGIAPGCDVAFALRPTANAWIVCQLMADSATVWPYHARDPNTMDQVFVPDWPNATLLSFKPALGPIGSTAAGCPYVPSPEHQVHFAAVAYLATRATFYRDELVAMANYGIIGQNPYYRGATGDQGLSLIYSDIRQKAWAIAGYVWAAALLPATDRFGAYFRQVVQNNAGAFAMAYLGDTSVFPNGITYPTKATIQPNQFANPMNVFADGSAFGEAAMNGGAGYPGWQDDYFTGVADWAVKLGFAEWVPVRNWKAGFTMHLFNDACPEFASSYLQCVAPVSAGPGKPPATWFSTYADGFKQAWPWAATLTCGSAEMLSAIHAHPGGNEGLPPLAGDMVGGPAADTGYPAIKRQAVAAAVNAGLTGAAAAWTYVTTRPTPIAWHNAKYNIVPGA